MFHPQTTICREGLYYLAIVVVVFGGAIFKEVNLLLMLAGMMLGPVLLNWQVVSANLRGLRVDRKLPRALGAGDLLSVHLSLTNARRRLGSWAVVVEEQIRRVTTATAGSHQPSLRPRVLFPFVSANESRKGSYRGRLVERGRYEFGPLRISTRFPFGLFSRTMTVGDTETLIVLPRLGRLTAGWAARRLDAFADTDRRRRRPGPEGDFYGVREWRVGDGRRLIHWRRSARLGKLVVRQLERPQNRDVAVVLDLWQSESATAEQADNVELAVSFAATVLSDLCRVGGSNVTLALRNAELECVGGSASPALSQRLMERLAVAEAQSNDALPALLEHALPTIDVGTEIVLISTRPIDLGDRNSFAPLWSDPALRERVRHIRCIDTSSETLTEFFQPL